MAQRIAGHARAAFARYNIVSEQGLLDGGHAGSKDAMWIESVEGLAAA